MRKSTGFLLLYLLAFEERGSTQQTEPERPGAVFSVTSTLVQIDAVVTDGKGRHINDLTAPDFEVLIDGKAQKITHFSYVQTVTPATTGQTVEPLRSKRKGQTLPAAPSAPLKREDVRRTTVLMVDDLGLSFESMAYVRRAVRKFIEEQIQKGDLVAICRTSGGSGAAQQFTNDRRVLLAIADGIRWNPSGRIGIGLFEPIGAYGRFGGPGNPGGDFSATDPTYQADRNAMLAVGTLGAVNYVVSALRELPGRKSIVLFSDGFAMTSNGLLPSMPTGGGSPNMVDYSRVVEAMRRLIDRANRSGTVVYTIHAAGLQTLQPTAQDNPTLGGDPSIGAQERQSILDKLTMVGEIGGRDVQFQIEQQGLAYLADQTGGLAYENGNDMNWGLERVLEDQAGYYVLGFRPPEGLFREKFGGTPYHRIHIRTKRRGLHVRTRTGFFGETDQQVLPALNGADQMRMAMLSPFRSNDLRLRLTSLFSEVPKGDETVVRNLVHIDAGDLRFELNSDGTISARVEMLAAATGADGKILKALVELYEFRVPSDHVQRVLSEGVVYAINVNLQKPGAYQIRVAVRDQATGKIGSANQFLEIPDIHKRRLALTSLVLQDGDRPAGAGGQTESRSRGGDR